jgi:hypothetical protein
MKRLVSLADVQAAYQWTGQAYASAGAVARFRILERVAEPDAVAQYLTLL